MPEKSSVEKQYAEIMKRSAGAPGVADLMHVYERLNAVYTTSQKVMQAVCPIVVSANSTTSRT